MIESLPYIMMLLLFSIVLAWRSISGMIKTRRVHPLLPIFLVGIGYCFRAAFVFYRINDNYIWNFLDLAMIIAVLWVTAIIAWNHYDI